MVGINLLEWELLKSMHKAPEISRNMFKKLKRKLMSQERKRYGNDPRWG